ncbi:MAG: beta-Ala-His dipeptidase, partial [Lachnospiraceae bacterium]|nr:beta-Ala-His dipeptidase [Lachnospiraceae bacterium]
MNMNWNNEVLNLFEQLSAIPRESGNEQAVSNWLKDRAEAKGLSVIQDDIWDLIIQKPGSAGHEDHEPVILQAHIDMVCEKNSDSDHDFTKDPILLKRDGDWIVSATGTTLGADNGIGAAAAMAILEDDTLPHPPLEVVFTVQEETTFAGAETVDVSSLKAKRMINLDHADERELIVGSCGGTGVVFKLPLEREPAIPNGYKSYQIKLTGLKGGHSGEDIHRGRGNAISLLLRLLEAPQLQVVSISGGTNRLAIPREAQAVVLVQDEETLAAIVQEAGEIFRKEYSESAPDLDIACQPAEAIPPLTEESFSKISAAVRLYPNGIAQMNGSFEGLVESSDNIGIISTDDDMLTLTSEIRGAYQSTVQDLKNTVDALAKFMGAQVEYFNGYVPWEFEAASELRSLAVGTFEEMFGGTMKQLALHAGLECGFFAEKIPGLDLISIGPDCQYFHSPQERVSITSIEHFYMFVIAVLAK